jgi:hypothetical protein
LILPRELRDEIYKAMIPPRLALNRPCGTPFIIVRDGEASGGELNMELEEEHHLRCVRGLADLRSRMPILFTNRQVFSEVLEVLYEERLFSFADSSLFPREMLEILKGLPPTSRTRIWHLRFDVWMFIVTTLAGEERQRDG